VQIHHVSIAVPDLDEAIEWYGRILGFRHPEQHAIRELGARMAFVRRGHLRLELWQLEHGKPVPPERREPNSDLLTCGTKHMALAVSDLPSFLGYLVRERVDIAAIQLTPTEPMRSVTRSPADGARPFALFIRDPGGVLIELLDAEALADAG